MVESGIRNGSKVMLNFSLALEQGEEIDSNFDGDPVELLVGNGDMLPGFEEVLIGLLAGETVETIIGHDKAFGEANPDNQQRFPIKSFENSIELTEGLVVSFADPAGGELPGVVIAVNEDYVEVDFNHPLAGKNILFKAHIHEVLS